MRFYYDLDLGQLVQTPGYPNAVNRVDFKRGDAAEIRLGFYQGGRQVSIGSGALLRFALKPSGKYDVDPVVSSEAWSFVDEATPEYFCNPSFNTVALNALFNHADGDYENDIASVDLMFEITWSLDNEVTWSSTDTVTARVYNDVIKGDEGVPLAGPPAYPTSVEVHHLTDNITVTAPVDLDSIQSSSEKGQPNGYASLDGDGKVPASELPSYVDDVLEFADLVGFPVAGDSGKIYVAVDTGLVYRWSGSVYVEISSGVDAPVASVNGEVGAVVLNADSLDDVSTDHKFVTAGEKASVATALQPGAAISLLSNDSGYAAAIDLTPQTATFNAVAGVINVDYSVGPNAKIELTGDAFYLSVNNSAVGDSGMLEITQDAVGGHVYDPAAGEVVLSGDPATIASITPTTGIGTVGWYKFGPNPADVYLYISDVT